VPRLSGLCLSERVLQKMRFGEIERPTTNQIPSLLRSLPEGFPCQTPKYESDVFSHNRRWFSAKPEHLPVHRRTGLV